MTAEPAAARRALAIRLEAEEVVAAMDATLRRAGGTAGIGRHGSTAAGLYAASGALLLGGRESHPLLLETAAEALASLLPPQAGTPAALAPDDVWLTNDPGCGAASLEDLILAAPLFTETRLLGCVVLTATHPGLGRATLTPARRLRREGLVLPWSRLIREGQLQEDTLRVLSANTDDPEAFRQDLAAQMHALRIGRETVEDLLERLGAEALQDLETVAKIGAERALAQTFSRLQSDEIVGRFGGAEVVIRRRECPLPVHLAWPSSETPLTPALARAAVRTAFREVLAVEAPALATLGGLAETLAIETNVTAEPARPTGAARFAGAQVAAGAVLAAFAGVLPHLAHAPDAAPILLDLRGRWDDGQRYRVRLGLPGGLGASVYGDGLTFAAPTFSPFRIHTVEEIERAFPLRVRRLEIIPASGGPGQYHGGLAVRMEIQILEGQAEADVLVPGRAIGMQGGMRGTDPRALHVTPRHGTREVRGGSRAVLTLEPGDRLVLESNGGGGWGIPFQRSIMRLEDDLARGLVTPDQSRNRYGLVLKPGTLEKDDYLTYRVRHYLLSTLAVEDIIAGEELLD